STVMRVDAAASALATSSFTISLNGSQSKTLTVLPLTQGNRYELAKGASAVQYFTPPTNANSLNFTMAYYKSTGTATGYLNFMEVNARRYLKMYGSAMQFQNMDYFNTNNYNKYLLSNANSNVKIWDITDPGNISSMVTENIDGKLAFVAPGKDVANYLAIDPTAASAFPKPEIVGVVPNQNLHALPPVEMVIISHPNFVQQANALAQAHREKDNMTVEVVTTEQVYNEFSSGTPDATAYRWVMKMLRDKALATNDIINGPKYLLLFGRGTYDNRKIFSNSGNNFILTYQADNSLVIVDSYLTDDYFGFLEDNEGTLIPSHSLDIGIGRLPVTTAQQASDVVNKITGYMKNENMGYWKNQLCFLADDGDAALHMTQSDTVASSVARKFPAFDVNKIYLDAFKQETSASGQSYPLARNQFHNLIRSGLFLIDYAGHAAPLGWTNENILTASDVKSLSNKNLPLFVGATCDFIQFDVQTISAGEQVVLNPMGGGIGIVSAARPVYANQNLNLNKQFCENLFRKVKKGEKWEHMRLGDVLSYAKNQLGTETNKLPYVLLGDPALKLNYPTTYQVVTSKINKNTSLVNDTLRALSVDSIRGFIADYNGNKISSFNGKVHVTVYDKIQRITTLNNDSDGTMTYNYRPNKLFAGDTNVKDGEFCISFLLPKDIKYNFGTGRINYYAQEDSTGTEAQGYFENFIIGGGSEDIIEDSIGPGIQLYLNSTNFVSGDKVNETPLVLADISDPHGINMVENGIGHDISLTIDEDLSQSYIVNNYFQAANNSFTEGSLKYKLPEMKEGKHTLAFKVWDLLNNSSKITVNFEVVKNLAPEIFSVYNYPNPVRSQTRIKVNHDRPETILYTTVEIFDLAGRSIWSFSQSNADDITWDATTNGGLKVKSGIYFYRVTVRTSKSEITSKTNKMLVVEQ
ncbi:MAG TPA: type IX secretion system sortase PorU, partial [Paludibacter sp.]|nr:type IX secretion system sortase PorU [Paludibacter sp.]